MLHMASANGHSALLQLLISQGPSPIKEQLLDIKNDEGNTALHWAALNGHVEVVEYLVKSGCDPKTRNLAGQSALYIAQANGKDLVEATLLRLVDYGQDSDDDMDSDGEEDEEESLIVEATNELKLSPTTLQ